jgi:hypothetical protein
LRWPAGLSGAVESTSIVMTAGLAEIAAGSIAMGLGGYLAARSDAEHDASERRREQAEIREILWLLGFVSGYTIGAFIHVLLVVAIVLFLVGLLSGRQLA